MITFARYRTVHGEFPFVIELSSRAPDVGKGEPDAATSEALELFAEFAEQEKYAKTAADFGFDPPPFTPTVEVPSGSTLIDVQNVWKEKKDGGRPVSTVFVVDVSGSMEGTRIQSLQRAMLSAREFIKPTTDVVWSSSTTPR